MIAFARLVLCLSLKQLEWIRARHSGVIATPDVRYVNFSAEHKPFMILAPWIGIWGGMPKRTRWNGIHLQISFAKNVWFILPMLVHHALHTWKIVNARNKCSDGLGQGIWWCLGVHDIGHLGFQGPRSLKITKIVDACWCMLMQHSEKRDSECILSLKPRGLLQLQLLVALLISGIVNSACVKDTVVKAATSTLQGLLPSVLAFCCYDAVIIIYIVQYIYICMYVYIYIYV